MNANDINLIKNSFSRIGNAAQDYSEVFYDTLFASSPSIKPLFKGDIAVQREKLKTTIAYVVDRLEQFDELHDAVFALGKRHVAYGVHQDDFPDVADALIKTFNNVLDDFSPEEEKAWALAINAIASVMLEAWNDEEVA